MPDARTVQGDGDGRRQGMGFAAQIHKVVARAGHVRWFIEPLTVAFQHLIRADDQRVVMKQLHL